MNHACKLGVCQMALLHLLFDEFADIDVLEVRFHGYPWLPLLCRRSPQPAVTYIYENVGTYFAHQKRGIAKHHIANESNINPHAVV